MYLQCNKHYAIIPIFKQCLYMWFQNQHNFASLAGEGIVFSNKWRVVLISKRIFTGCFHSTYQQEHKCWHFNNKLFPFNKNLKHFKTFPFPFEYDTNTKWYSIGYIVSKYCYVSHLLILIRLRPMTEPTKLIMLMRPRSTHMLGSGMKPASRLAMLDGRLMDRTSKSAAHMFSMSTCNERFDLFIYLVI